MFDNDTPDYESACTDLERDLNTRVAAIASDFDERALSADLYNIIYQYFPTVDPVSLDGFGFIVSTWLLPGGARLQIAYDDGSATVWVEGPRIS
jgi:hypothetical protein